MLKKSFVIVVLLLLVNYCFSNSNVFVDCFSEKSGVEYVNVDVAKASTNAKSLVVDTTKNATASVLIFRTNKSLFSTGKTYTATIKYNIANANSAKFAKMQLKAIADNNEIATYNLFASKPNNIAKLKFDVPQECKQAWFELSGEGQFVAELTNIKIIEGNGEKFIPATPNATTSTTTLKNLPTGATEFEVQFPKIAKKIVVNGADFGVVDSNENCAIALNKAIAHARKIKATHLVIPHGTYKFFSDTPVMFENLTDFTFDANGSTFVFCRKNGSANMHVKNCLRTKISNLKMDYDWQTDPLAAIVKMVSHGKENKSYYWEFELVDYNNSDNKYALANKKIRIANFEAWNPQTRSIGADKVPNIFFGFSPKDKGPRMKWMSDSRLRVYIAQKYYQRLDYKLALNKYYRMKHMHYGIGGFELFGNKHFTMENVRILSCKGHAIHINGAQQNYQFINVDILPPENDKLRVITCTADHIHVVRSLGNFKLENCDLSLGSDDCMNVHDVTSFGLKSGENEITLKSRISYKVGDTLEFVHSNYEPANFKAKVVKTNYKDKNNRKIILDKKLPEPKYDGFVMYNNNFDSSNLIIRNCTFSANRARSLLMLTKNITIENCKFFNTQMGAIKFESGFTRKSWCEGFGVNNVVVRNCVFDNTNVMDRKYQDKAFTIFMGVYLHKDPSFEQSDFPVISNILLENNTFNDSYGVVALISSAKNITFRNNTISSKRKRIEEHYYRGSLYLNRAENVNIVNNNWIASPLIKDVGVYYDSDTVKNVLFEGNVLK